MSYQTHNLAEWLAFSSLGVSVSSAIIAPFLLLIDADYWAWPDLRPVVDRLLVEVVRAKGSVRNAASTVAALLMLLTTPTKGALR